MKSSSHRFTRRVVSGLLCSLAVALPSRSGAEEPFKPEYLVKSWTTADGLPQNTVQAIAQTPDGYLWLGTRGGLACFDGVRFKTYGLAEGLKSVNTVELADDGTGGLWIATHGGGLSHLSKGIITTCTTAEGLMDNVVLAVASDTGRGAWVGGRKGLQHFDGVRFTAVDESTGLPAAEISALVPGREGVLWVATVEAGLFRMKEGRFESLVGPGGEKFTRPWLLPDHKGGLWVSLGNARILHYGEGGWIEYNAAQGAPASVVYSLAEDENGEIWAGSAEEGLHVFRDGRFHPVTEGGKVHRDPSIRSVRAGDNGIIWVGTQSGGLSRLTRQEVRAYPVGQPGRRGRVNGLVEQVQGRYLVTTWGGGLYRGPLDQFQLQEHAPELSANPFLLSGLQLRNGESCVFGYKLILRIASGSRDILSIPTEETWMAGCESARGELWLGSSRGEVRTLVGDTTMIVPNGSFPAAVHSLAAGRDGEIWIATAGAGLFRWHAGATKRWTVAEGLPTDMLQTLYRDATGTLWIGTGGGGLAWLKDGKIRRLDSSRGLVDDFINQILEDDDGNLWLGCHRGIFRASKKELEEVAAGKADAIHPLALDESDGMPASECTGGYGPSGLRTKSGLLLFPTPEGIVEVDPRRFGAVGPPPAVRIESVTVDGKNPVSPGWPVEVRPGQREVEFRFTAFNYHDPDKIRFRYRLEDRDATWTQAGPLRTARFSLLPPGAYKFQVSAANTDGHWSEPCPSVGFTVQPLYWQTGWFRAFIVLLLMGIGGALAAWRARFQLRRSEERERLARAEAETQQHLNEVAHLTRVATLGELSSALAHELNQPLAAILGNAQVGSRDLQDGAPDLPEITAILDDIAVDAKRAGGIIHGMRAMFRKDVVTEPQPVDLNDAVNQTTGLLHSEIVGRKVMLVLQLGENLPPARAGRVEIQQILINLVLNGLDAMKAAGPEARLTISTLQRGDQLELGVHDSGAGIPPEMIDRLFEPFASSKQGGLGLGLAISRSIAERFLGKLLAENHPHGGAMFRLILPVDTD
jgi:signal transduction histidine kinase/ligand-binding sensor domain-containing protein